MKKKIYLISGLIFSLTLMFTLSSLTLNKEATGSFKYVGVDGCTKACHKSEEKGKQLDIWKSSKHSQAWTALTTPDADKIAKDKGFTTPAAETPFCIKCHVLGKDIDPAELSDTFKKEDGVQCESCHGAGSDYKSLSVMKDVAQAKEKGLIMDKSDTFCKTCHNPESPSYKEFKFDDAWALIKHPKP
jgi:hypothetical protein